MDRRAWWAHNEGSQRVRHDWATNPFSFQPLLETLSQSWVLILHLWLPLLSLHSSYSRSACPGHVGSPDSRPSPQCTAPITHLLTSRLMLPLATLTPSLGRLISSTNSASPLRRGGGEWFLASRIAPRGLSQEVWCSLSSQLSTCTSPPAPGSASNSCQCQHFLSTAPPQVSPPSFCRQDFSPFGSYTARELGLCLMLC